MNQKNPKMILEFLDISLIAQFAESELLVVFRKKTPSEFEILTDSDFFYESICF
jgi:hypothetical protein